MRTLKEHSKKSNTVESIVLEGNCIACGVCKVVCPEAAIDFDLSSKYLGQAVPLINKERCIGCGICLKICYGNYQNQPFNQITDAETMMRGPIESCYQGYASDPNYRYNCASGGIVTSLLVTLFQKGRITGATIVASPVLYPNLLQARLARSIEEIKESKGSKYAPVDFSSSLKDIKMNDRIAFVGLPCHLYAIKRSLGYLGIKKESAIFIGLICGGCPRYEAIEYIMMCYHLERKKPIKIRYRGDGWPGKLKIESNSNTFLFDLTDYWPKISPWFSLKRCFTCLMGFNPEADIACGDLWLPISDDNFGRSLVIVRSSLGKEIIELINKKEVNLSSLDTKYAFLSQKGVLEDKYEQYRVRERISRCFPKVYSRRNQVIAGSSIRIFNMISVVLVEVGWFLASHRSLWNIFSIYTQFLKILFRK